MQGHVGLVTKRGSVFVEAFATAGPALLRGRMAPSVVEVQCPECGSCEVVRYGRQTNGEQRYRGNNVDCGRRIFLGRYHHSGRLPEVKRQIVDMALNGSGIRDTARVLGVSPMTVMSTLKKKRRRFTR